MSNYEEMNIQQDPIALIKAIKGITYSFCDQKIYPEVYGMHKKICSIACCVEMRI